MGQIENVPIIAGGSVGQRWLGRPSEKGLGHRRHHSRSGLLAFPV